jgi:hypothetical protein
MLDLTKLDKTKDIIIYNISNAIEATKVKNYFFNTEYKEVFFSVVRWTPSNPLDNCGALVETYSKERIIEFYINSYTYNRINILNHIFYDYQNDEINDIFVKKTKVIGL